MWWRDRRVSRPGTSSRFPEPLRVLIVGVNTATHVYHKEGSRFYGQTKKGKYVSEADAIKAKMARRRTTEASTFSRATSPSRVRVEIEITANNPKRVPILAQQRPS